jgi:hypothetical protein
MSKSRRGFIAAGLAVAVVGALGAAWTFNADADQMAPTGAPVPPAADSPPAPPALLPWGEKPTTIRTGRIGTGSDALRGEGFAAARDGSGSTQPRGRYGPKGRSGPRSSVRSEVTDITPPAAPEPTTSTPTDAKVFYYYNLGAQLAVTDGVFANVTIAKPKLGDGDYHSLAELAAQSADGKQIVEVGWTVDPLVNGDSNAHLFVYHWVNGSSSCYNGCGWEQYSKTVKPGDTLSDGVTKKFGIQYSGGAWWIAFDTEFIG